MEYIPTIEDSWFADGNTFMNTTEQADWFGALTGTSYDVGKVVIHTSGAWSYKAIALFEGTVDGRYGTLEISLVGKRPDASSEWYGTWVILRGTGDLANLHGQGTFWGLGFVPPDNPEDPPVPGIIDYEGKIHFDPE
jgi:hypothetical protein